MFWLSRNQISRRCACSRLLTQGSVKLSLLPFTYYIIGVYQSVRRWFTLVNKISLLPSQMTWHRRIGAHAIYECVFDYTVLFFSSILTNQKDTTIKVTNTMHMTIWKQTEKNIGYTQSFSGILIIIICIQNFVVTFILKLCAESESDQLTSDHILHDCVCVDAYMMEYLVYSIRYCLRLR